MALDVCLCDGFT
ncbi:hypothetical protein NMS34_003367 [Vibrio cholerae]|nr:hypothetical protein [Vibrio cholerae]